MLRRGGVTTSGRCCLQEIWIGSRLTAADKGERYCSFSGYPTFVCISILSTKKKRVMMKSTPTAKWFVASSTLVVKHHKGIQRISID